MKEIRRVFEKMVEQEEQNTRAILKIQDKMVVMKETNKIEPLSLADVIEDENNDKHNFERDLSKDVRMQESLNIQSILLNAKTNIWKPSKVEFSKATKYFLLKQNL